MPHKRHSDRWEHPTYKYAYIREFRGMACTVIHGSAPVSTGYVWKTTSRTAAMKVLNDRLADYLAGGAVVRKDTMNCAALLEQFLEARNSRLTQHRFWEYMRYMKAFVPGSININDTPKIRKAILARIESSEYAPNTRRQALKRIRTVFAFGIEQGWLQTNPVYRDMIPIEEVTEAEPYTDEDLAAALESLKGRSKVFLQFLMATGCRAVEAVRLSWDHVKDDHVIIDGKRVRASVPNMRIIPFALCPELPEIMAEASQATWGKGERVFGAQNYQVPARAFSDAMGDKGRGFHDVRKWAINKWVRQGWPERVIEAVAGHDEAVSKKHYRTPFSASELVSMVNEKSSTKKVARARKKADSL